MEKMYVVNTGRGYYPYFDFGVFLENLNGESDFRDLYPEFRQDLKYVTTSVDAAISQTVMMAAMECFN